MARRCHPRPPHRRGHRLPGARTASGCPDRPDAGCWPGSLPHPATTRTPPRRRRRWSREKLQRRTDKRHFECRAVRLIPDQQIREPVRHPSIGPATGTPRAWWPQRPRSLHRVQQPRLHDPYRHRPVSIDTASNRTVSPGRKRLGGSRPASNGSTAASPDQTPAARPPWSGRCRSARRQSPLNPPVPSAADSTDGAWQSGRRPCRDTEPRQKPHHVHAIPRSRVPTDDVIGRAAGETRPPRPSRDQPLHRSTPTTTSRASGGFHPRGSRLLEGGPTTGRDRCGADRNTRDRAVARDDVTHAGVSRRADPGRQRHNPRIDDRSDPWLEIDRHRRVAGHPHPPVRHLI